GLARGRVRLRRRRGSQRSAGGAMGRGAGGQRRPRGGAGGDRRTPGGSAGSIRKRRTVMKWVTRARPKVDRVACPWLIRRFVDKEAEFLYVPPDQVAAVAKREGATPFDVPGAELGHHGAECSFDAVIRKYGLGDPALGRLARIVRGADTDAKDLTPESCGLEAIADGFRLVYQDDHELLEHEMPVYDALYAYCRGLEKR